MLTSNGNIIEGELRALIARSAPGTRLPSVRELARRHQASPVTVQRVVSTLEREGLVDAQPGHGTFVAHRARATVADVSWQTLTLDTRPLPGDMLSALGTESAPGLIPMATGYPDSSIWSLGLLSAAASRAGRRPEAWGRTAPQGLPALRSWFANDAGGGARPDDAIIVSGGQAALSAAFRGLAAPGDAVVVESPTYVGAIEAARLAGLRLVAVPTDHDGVRPDLLDAALRSSGARLVYLQPTLANPSGATLATERRSAVLEAARAAGAFIVEDDYVRDFVSDLHHPPLLRDDADGHVAYIRSLTKSVAPALRIAGVIARGPAMARLRNARTVDDFFVSGMLQETALGVVTAPGWSRHLSAARRTMAERMRVALEAIDHVDLLELVVRPTDGFLLWTRLHGVDDATFVQRARDRGVALTAGSAWFCTEPDASYVRWSVASSTTEQIAEAFRRLEGISD
jgi:DNA-binding transcriptional MocR family regulator